MRFLFGTIWRTRKRTLSIILALAGGAGLIWFLLVRAKWNPPTGAEFFWFRVFAAFWVYAVVQLWTLAMETGQGTELPASFDKFAALTPMIAFCILEVYWIGAESIWALSWRHHAVGSMWAIFSLADYFATDMTNQRLAQLVTFTAAPPGAVGRR